MNSAMRRAAKERKEIEFVCFIDQDLCVGVVGKFDTIVAVHFLCSPKNDYGAIHTKESFCFFI